MLTDNFTMIQLGVLLLYYTATKENDMTRTQLSKLLSTTTKKEQLKSAIDDHIDMMNRNEEKMTKTKIRDNLFIYEILTNQYLELFASE